MQVYMVAVSETKWRRTSRIVSRSSKSDVVSEMRGTGLSESATMNCQCECD